MSSSPTVHIHFDIVRDEKIAKIVGIKIKRSHYRGAKFQRFISHFVEPDNRKLGPLSAATNRLIIAFKVMGIHEHDAIQNCLELFELILQDKYKDERFIHLERLSRTGMSYLGVKRTTQLMTFLTIRRQLRGLHRLTKP